MTTDEIYISRCIELAKKAEGETFPNPVVGAVIVHNGKIIGEGYHEKAGEPHAEINAIRSVRNPLLLPESEIYVSLEPCSHFGRTPPCALALKEIGFRRVIVGTQDSHDKVQGKGIKTLREAGIEVTAGVLANGCRELNRRFFTFHEKKRPYIVLKWAESADAFMDKNFQPTQIGNSLSKQLVHQLRSREHGILVGTQTALRDNPLLTVRDISGRNPIRILIDMDLKVPKDFKIFNSDAPTVIINKIRNGTHNHLTFIKICMENFLESLLEKLHEIQLHSVFIEGGRFTLQQFIDAGLWDEAILIRNKNLQLHHGTRAPDFPFEPVRRDIFRDNCIDFYRKSIGI